MKLFHRRRQVATRCALYALSDKQLKDIGLCRSGIEFTVTAGTASQFAAIQPRASRRRWRKTQILSGRAHIAATVLSIALGLALILVIASAATFYLVNTPIVDMRL